MLDPESDSEAVKTACYAAYHESVRSAYKLLSDSIIEYFTEHPELYRNQTLAVPPNFRPLNEYRRTLRVQKLTLTLALGIVELSGTKVLQNVEQPFHANGSDTPSSPMMVQVRPTE
jgi:hypothetical protein